MDRPIHTYDEEALVVLGVDTHADAHVAVALDGLGRRLGHKTVPSREAGYAALVAWAEELGALVRAGVEGSGSFGVGLARFLRARGVEVVEVNRPNRQHRRRFGKHDPADAEAAARALQANTATGEPKTADGPAEMVRGLHVVRRSAVKARTQAANQLRAARHRAGRTQGKVAQLFHGQAGRHRSALPSGRPSQRSADRDQAGDEVRCSSPPAAFRGDRRAGGADRAFGVRGRPCPRLAPGRRH